MSYELYPHQKQAIEGLYKWFHTKEGNPLVVMPTGCHAKGTMILMHNGSSKAVEDITLNDKLMGPDSLAKNVTKVISGNEIMYKIIPVKGEPFVVNENHILSLQSTNEGKSHWRKSTDGEDIKNVSVKEWINWSKSQKHLYKLRRSGTVYFPVMEKPVVEPYRIGMLLGDGHLYWSISLTTMDKELTDAAIDLADQFDLEVRISKKENTLAHTITFGQTSWSCNTKNPLTDALKQADIFGMRSHDKLIPDEYKYGSVGARYEILAGLIDTDGSLTGNCFDFISKSRNLSEDVVFVSRSLGMAAYLKECKKKDQNKKEGTYYRVSISGDIDLIPTRIPRKQATERKQIKSVLKTGFSVEKVGNGDFYGFTLDRDHLYLTEDFTIHHNSGKSIVLSTFLRDAILAWPETRAIIVSHVKELLVQDYTALIRTWPDAPAGIYSAGLQRKDINSQIVICGIQSIHKQAYLLQKIDLVLIDEAHLVSRNESGMYRKFLNQLKEINPDIKIIGFTATHYRTDSGRLDEGEDRLFDGVAIEIGIQKLINEGYLCDVLPYATKTVIDISNVGTRAGEFIPGQLEAAVDITEVTTAAVDEIVRAGQDHKCGSWLLFCCGVDHAMHVRDEVRKWGISCETVLGDTPGPQRDRIIREFKAGKIQCLTSMGVLTTGFDAPGVDLIGMLRPTQSLSLHVQMIGRGTRTAPGKESCIVLDFAGNSLRHGPLDTVDGRKKFRKNKDDEPGLAPGKTCPECQLIVGAATLICKCGHEFPPPKVKLSSVSATAPLLASQITAQWIPVTQTLYGRHTKEDKPDSMVVTYQCGMVQHREWVMFEHGGLPRQKAAVWWAKRSPGSPVPNSTTEALERALVGHELSQATAICIRPQGKYVDITGVKF